MMLKRHTSFSATYRAAACALLPLLLLAGCASTPKNPSASTDASAGADNNEPDLLAQLRERMANGTLKQTSKAQTGVAADVKKDTSASPALKTADATKQAAAAAVAGDYAKALGLMSANKDADAMALLQKIAAAAPQFSGPQVNQAIILLKQEKFADATALLRAALVSNPHNPYAFNLLGVALREQGKFADAKAAYESALAIDPNYAKAHFNYGVLADMYMQDLPLALTHYERYQALQSKPDTVVDQWITSLQKRTGTYKAPVPVALPPPEPSTTETTESAEASSTDNTATAAAANTAPAEAAAPAQPSAAEPAASTPAATKSAPSKRRGKKS